MRVAVLTISDSVSQGQREDLSGPAVVAFCRGLQWEIVTTPRVSDDLEAIQEQLREMTARIEALRRSSSEAGESLLRLHGEQKQAEEALVHQAEALRKLEANEHDLLETSMRVRDP